MIDQHDDKKDDPGQIHQSTSKQVIQIQRQTVIFDYLSKRQTNISIDMRDYTSIQENKADDR